MQVPRLSRLPRRALVVAVLATTTALPGFVAAPAGADPAADVATTTAAYDEARLVLRDAAAVLDGARAERDGAQHRRDAARDQHEADQDALVRARDRYGEMSAEYYVRQGAEDSEITDSMRLALTGRRERLDQAKEDEAASAEALAEAEDVLDDVREVWHDAAEQHGAALAAAQQASIVADAAIADTGARDLSAIAYSAYRRAAADADQRHPGCDLPAAVLAGMGRITSGHGRNKGSTVDHLGNVAPEQRGLRGTRAADTDGGALDGDPDSDRAMGPLQIMPATWEARALDGDGDGVADPDNIFDASATAAEVLCTRSSGLGEFGPLRAAVLGYFGESQQTAVSLGAARRYARAEGLDLGTVPIDPDAAAGDGEPQFDISDTALAPGDVLGMIDWGMTRLGTPYSQCLGPEVRPQDPICPPGTNRFGSGFFDCSGFVSSAYRRIGLTVPATTYAMEADATFMSTKVASRIDTRVMEPGDVFLMDGHTGMYVGDGMIVHAIGGGLTYERVPTWVANGTFAVLRPSQLFPAEWTAPPLDLSGLAGLVPAEPAPA